MENSELRIQLMYIGMTNQYRVTTGNLWRLGATIGQTWEDKSVDLETSYDEYGGKSTLSS